MHFQQLVDGLELVVQAEAGVRPPEALLVRLWNYQTADVGKALWKRLQARLGPGLGQLQCDVDFLIYKHNFSQTKYRQ